MTASCCMCFPSWSLSTLPDQTTVVEAGPADTPEGGGQAEDDIFVLVGFKGQESSPCWALSTTLIADGGRPAPSCFPRRAPRWGALAPRAVLGSWFLSQTVPEKPPPFPHLPTLLCTWKGLEEAGTIYWSLSCS